MSEAWAKDVFVAFQSDGSLQNRILDAAHRYPGELPALFGDIAKYVLATQQSTTSAIPTTSKKRKLDDAPVVTNGTKSTEISNPAVSFECNNVSFQVPARKKLKIELVADQADNKKQEVRLVDPKTNEREHTLGNGPIEEIFCLPVPEKQQRQWNFCIFPRSGATNAEGMPCEQMVFTLNETKPDDATSSSRPAAEGDTYISVMERELNQLLQPYGKHVVRPTDAEFASSIPQSHRKGEKAYHVKAHRGTKEGYLFFLPNGIVFGFKKPLSYFAFASIESISYTSVLQRTFNLVIASSEGPSADAEVKETEFSMLDQADFAGIDEYVKRHGLNDASMAAQRKAKAYNVNKEGKAAEANGEAGAGGQEEDSELQKAEQQLQDEEDELEEDYEASGGESDGEGEDSEAEDGEEGEEYAEDEDGEEYDDDEGMEHEE